MCVLLSKLILSSFVVGTICDMAYLSDNEHMFSTGKVKSIVCTASTDGTVRAWNIQEVRKECIGV